MKTAIWYYLFLILVKIGFVAFLVSGCKPKHIASSEKVDKTDIKDSSSLKETVRTKTITLPGETIYIEIPCDEKKSPEKKVEGKRASASFTRGSDGVVRGVVNCSELQAVVVAKDREIFRLRSEKKEKAEVRIVPMKFHKTRWYDIPCRWIALIALAYAGLKIFLKLKFRISI